MARGRLVLLRGGLDDARPTPESDDWSDFCARIGFVPRSTALPDDFEDRLAERLFGASVGERGVAPTQAIVPASLGEPSRGEAPSRARGVVRFVSVSAAAAAILVLVLATLFSSSSRPTASERPTPDPDGTNAAKTRDLPPAPEAPKESPRDASPEQAPTVTAPKPPGALLAIRSRTRDDASPEVAHVAATSARAASVDEIAQARTEAPAADSSEASDTLALALPIAPHATLASLPAGWSDVEATPVRRATRDAAWTIAGGDRWYGVALSPNREQTAGVGVMAQVDLGRALDQL